MLENEYQAKLIKKLRVLFPGVLILKNDTGYRQGIPDLSLLATGWWALLEVKKSDKEPEQPNQDWYIATADRMSFGAFIYPQNEKEVLDALQQSFQSRRAPRIS